jgi:hypothetical protein
VTGDVGVSASLSDRRLPFVPEGDTRQLDDLDRVSVAITAPHAGATFGDFSLDGGRGEFARFSRQLTGVQGRASAGGATWDVAAAAAKGERRSYEWRGEEGKQGPYALLPAGVGSPAEGIVAGSERVWLDGAERRRGADADYVIDYEAATITFTTRRPITSQSRIAIDFEAVAGGFRRNLYAATTGGHIARGGEWYSTFVREGDDPRAPVGADLTAADRRALAAMGDSAQGVGGRGVRYVGPGSGEYVWDASVGADPHWVYLGRARGEYLVEFTSVGDGRGAYRDTLGTDGARFFRYMGKSLGAYAPGGEVPVPTSRQLVDVGGTARLPGALVLEAEIARSADDRNRLSSLDDGDNAGAAGRAALRLEPRPVSLFGRALGSARGHASFRSVGDRFRSMDRVDGAFEGERWNQTASALGERRGELELEYQISRALLMNGEMGVRTLSGGSRSVRRAAGASLTGALAGSFRFEDARNAGPSGLGGRTRTSAELGRGRGALRPSLRVVEERIAGQEGDSVRARRGREAGASLVWSGPALTFRTAYTHRTERREAAGGPTSAREGTWEGAATIRRGAAFLLDLGVTQRRSVDAGQAHRSDLASLAVLAGRPGAAFSSELRWDVTQLRERRLIRRFVPVGAGSGSYDANGNPLLGGGYDAVSGLGDPESRSRATVQLRLDAYPGRPSAGARRTGPWRALGGSTLLRVETLSHLALGAPRYAFSPGAYLDPESTLRGTLNARQTIDVAPPGAAYDVQLAGGVTRDLSNEYEALRLTADGTDARIRLRAPLPQRVRLTGSLAVDRTVRSSARADALPNDRSERRGRAADLELARTFTARWGVSLLAHVRHDRDRTHDGIQTAWSAGPAARYAAGGRLRLDARALYATASQRGPYAPAGLYLQPVLGPRVAYNLLGEYRLREQVALTISLDGESRFHARDIYTGSFELRSYF